MFDRCNSVHNRRGRGAKAYALILFSREFNRERIAAARFALEGSLKAFFCMLVSALLIASVTTGSASQISTDGRTAVPRDVQQLVVIDYRILQESSAGMELRNRVMLPELKQLEESLRKSGLNDNHDVEQLAFVIFRSHADSDETMIAGIAQGQFSMQDVLANFRKQKVKPVLVRTNKVYPMGTSGMQVAFLDASTLVFGSTPAIRAALDAHDGQSPNMLSNNSIMDAMRSIDSEPLWSILDKKGTETMLRSALGDAGSLTDFDTVRKRLQASYYTMNFQHGVHFDLTIVTGDTFAAAAMSSLMSAAVMLRKATGSQAEKSALAATTVSSDSGKLTLRFASSEAEFDNLLKSPLFSSIIH